MLRIRLINSGIAIVSGRSAFLDGGSRCTQDTERQREIEIPDNHKSSCLLFAFRLYVRSQKTV